ncbi:hypothetical protein GCM10022252_66030 [Streptosporangium oxazolinicum]|uniref:Uncharacterized protein n=1 Tax=Streptosporangium oxazolinicum TaxID=909287 RepID=A0ABP8BF55_9ACTN
MVVLIDAGKAAVVVNFEDVFFAIRKAPPLMAEGGSVVVNASRTFINGQDLVIDGGPVNATPG